MKLRERPQMHKFTFGEVLRSPPLIVPRVPGRPRTSVVTRAPLRVAVNLWARRAAAKVRARIVHGWPQSSSVPSATLMTVCDPLGRAATFRDRLGPYRAARNRPDPLRHVRAQARLQVHPVNVLQPWAVARGLASRL